MAYDKNNQKNTHEVKDKMKKPESNVRPKEGTDKKWESNETDVDTDIRNENY